MSEPAKLLGIGAACARLDVSRSTLRAWVAQGMVPAFKVGARLRFRAEDLDALVRRVEPAPVPNGGMIHVPRRAA